MRHLKKFNEKYEYDTAEKAVNIFGKLGIEWTIGDDHLGNDNVFLFNKNGYDFEIYTIPQDTYHLNYGKNGNWIENFYTHDLEKSLSEILFESFNEGISSCEHCGLKKEMYYKSYCPKCDIQEIIKHKRGSVCLIPILNYGKQFIDGFDKDKIWRELSDEMHGNDTYLEYTFSNSDIDVMLKRALDELNVPIEDDEVLFWVSW